MVSLAEGLWRAILPQGDHHGAMNDERFVGWLEHRVDHASQERFGQKITLALDNAPNHHGLDPEVKVPQSNSKLTEIETGAEARYEACARAP